MIGKNGAVQYSVSIKDKDGNTFPEVEHQGVTYVVCKAGQQFQVKVSCKSPHWKPKEIVAASLSVNGRDLESYKYLHEKQPSITYEGWRIDHKTTKAFVSSAPGVRTDTSAVNKNSHSNSDPGTIKVVFEECENYLCPALEGRECYHCNFNGWGTRTITTAAPESAGSISQADGKKFYLQPSLSAKAGAQIIRGTALKERVHSRKKIGGRSYTMQLRFETAPISSCGKS